MIIISTIRIHQKKPLEEVDQEQSRSNATPVPRSLERLVLSLYFTFYTQIQIGYRDNDNLRRASSSTNHNVRGKQKLRRRGNRGGFLSPAFLYFLDFSLWIFKFWYFCFQAKGGGSCWRKAGLLYGSHRCTILYTRMWVIRMDMDQIGIR